jgi:tetratricopeptide (TPR) repeat protein
MKELIKINPEHADALNFVGYTYAEDGENLDEAEALVKKALALSPDKGYILDSLGWVYYQKGRYDEAITVLREAAEKQPGDPSIYEHLGDAYSAVGDNETALTYYRQGLDIISEEESPDDDEAELRARLMEKIERITQVQRIRSEL